MLPARAAEIWPDIAPEYVTETVRELARAIICERANGRRRPLLAVLADALQDAEYPHEDILAQLRDPNLNRRYVRQSRGWLARALGSWIPRIVAECATDPRDMDDAGREAHHPTITEAE